jgi:hypothetical protein
MKGFNILLGLFMVVFSCKGQDAPKEIESNPMGYISVGDNINAQNVNSNITMLEKYEALKVSDTLESKFTAKVKEVCKVKGCWMKLELSNNEEVMVRFKDYGFFMPSDLQGKNVIVNGLAFVEEMSVDDQKHYAKDGGASDKEINKISQPKKTFGFEANGVLIKE